MQGIIIIENKYATESEIEDVKKDVKSSVEECVKFAEESPLPPKEELYKDVYVQEDYPFIKE